MNWVLCFILKGGGSLLRWFGVGFPVWCAVLCWNLRGSAAARGRNRNLAESLRRGAESRFWDASDPRLFRALCERSHWLDWILFVTVTAAVPFRFRSAFGVSWPLEFIMWEMMCWYCSLNSVSRNRTVVWPRKKIYCINIYIQYIRPFFCLENTERVSFSVVASLLMLKHRNSSFMISDRAPAWRPIRGQSLHETEVCVQSESSLWSF